MLTVVEKYKYRGIYELRETEAFERLLQTSRRTAVLMAEKLHRRITPVKPVIVEGLTTVEQVFEHFKPKVEMDFETEDGVSKKETLGFNNLGDFGVKENDG